MRMLEFFLLVVSQNVMSCPVSPGNISCVLQLRLKKEKEIFLPDVKNSQLHQERFSHITEKLQQVKLSVKWRSRNIH